MSSFFKKIVQFVAPDTRGIVFEDYESIVQLGAKEQRIFITIHDTVYDLTDYTNHPGGFKVLELCKGKDATEVFEKYHWPEGSSRKQMKKFKIGVLRLKSSKSQAPK